MGQQLEQSAPAAEERAEATRVAEEELKSAEAKKKDCADKLKNAQDREKEASESLSASKAAGASYSPEYQKSTEAKNEAAAALENFKSYNMSCFETLRDKMARPVEVEKAAEASPAKDEVVTTMETSEPVQSSPAKQVAAFPEKADVMVGSVS